MALSANTLFLVSPNAAAVVAAIDTDKEKSVPSLSLLDYVYLWQLLR